MGKTNIDRFDEITALILSTLYSRFPEPVFLSPTELGLSEEVPSRDATGGVIYSSEWKELSNFIDHSAYWLAEEGYLSQRPGRFSSRYTLSAAGLKSMKHVDQPEIGNDTLGEKLKKASSEGAKATTSKLVDQFLAVGATLLTKSIGIE
ncbi:hypothetical protein D3C77_454660 [compost metagenome]